MRPPVTTKQQLVLDFITRYTNAHGASPTIEEIRSKLGCRSLRTVVQYLESLERKGYIARRKNAKRNIEILSLGEDNRTISIPVVASVGCDDLSVFAQDTSQHDEFIEVDEELVDDAGDIVAVRAIGDSMLDAGIHSGDYILVQFTNDFKDGDRVAAVVNDMVVVKRLEHRDGLVVLRPESKDPKYKPIIVGENFKITGKVLCVVPASHSEITEVVPLSYE